MFRIYSVLFALAACGGESSSGIDHTLTTCDISTGSNAGMTCERACASSHDETGIGCDARSEATGAEIRCDGTFGLEGTIGCCIAFPGSPILRFAECQ